MSIAIAFIGIDGIVMATDSRKTEGEITYRDDEKKLWKLDSGWYLTMISDDTKFGKLLVDVIRTRIAKRKNITSAFMQDLSGNLRKTFDFYMKDNPFPLERWATSIMLAGYVKQTPKIVALGASIKSPAFVYAYRPWAIETVSRAATHLLRQLELYLYKKDKSGEDIALQPTSILKNIATMIIVEASESNKISVGGKIQMVVIRPSNSEIVEPEDLEILKQKCAQEMAKSRGDLFQKLKEIK